MVAMIVQRGLERSGIPVIESTQSPSRPTCISSLRGGNCPAPMRGRAIFTMLAAVTLVAAPLASHATARRARTPSAVADPGDAGGPLDLSFAGLTQRGTRLVLTAGTRGAWAPEQLNPYPSEPAASFLCLRISRPAGSSQLCVGPPGPDRRTYLAFSILGPDGKPVSGSTKAIRARISRFDQSTIRAAFRPRAAGFNPSTGFDW